MAGVLVVGQMGGPTAVVNASLAGVIQAARQHQNITTVYGMIHGVEGLLKDRLVDLGSMNDGQLFELRHTPGAALGSTRIKVIDEDYPRMLDALRQRGARYLALIGGNGTMSVCRRLSEMAGDELRIIGIPKTIDNDLAETYFSPGYPSAARFLALAARDAGLDLEAMTTFDDVIILETFGRNTGWLAAGAALLKEGEDDAPHLIYVPEIPFDDARFVDDVKRVHSRLKRCFVVVAEGIKDADGKFIGMRNAGHDAMGRVVHSFANGVGAYLAEIVRAKLRLNTRVLRPGTIGRVSSTSVSHVDRNAAFGMGEVAVTRLAAGENGVMLAIHPSLDANQIPSVLLSRVAGVERLLPREYLDDAGTMISPAFRGYALPLVNDPAIPAITRLPFS